MTDLILEIAMKCLICDCSVLDDDTLYDRAYASLSEYRKRKADGCRSRKDARQSVTAGLFLRSIENGFGEIICDGYGKPHTNGIEFNISHSGDYVVFACSKSPLGIDIERIGRGIDIAERVMTAPEYDEFLNDVKENDREDVFCRMWTAKESYMKCSGLGFRLPPDSFRVLHGYEVRSPDDDVTITELDHPDGYRISVCSADVDCSLDSVGIEELLRDDFEL